MGDSNFDDVIDGVSERLVMTKRAAGGRHGTLLDRRASNDIFFDVPATIDATTIFARFRYGEYEHRLPDRDGRRLARWRTTPSLRSSFCRWFRATAPTSTPMGMSMDLISSAWQLGFGTTSGATPEQGDVNGDGAVDGADLADWETDFGDSAHRSGVVAAMTEAAEDQIAAWRTPVSSGSFPAAGPVLVTAPSLARSAGSSIVQAPGFGNRMGCCEATAGLFTIKTGITSKWQPRTR